jgi:hypothetical protein
MRIRRWMLRIWVIAALSMAVGSVGEFIELPDDTTARGDCGASYYYAPYGIENDVLRVRTDDELAAELDEVAGPELTAERLDLLEFDDRFIVYSHRSVIMDDDSGIFLSTRRYGWRRITLEHPLETHPALQVSDAVLIGRLRPLIADAMLRDGYSQESADEVLLPDMYVSEYNWILVAINGLPFALLLYYGSGFVYASYRRQHIIDCYRRCVCVKCGYSLRGLDTATCPECGTAFDPARVKAAQESAGAGDG